MPTAKKRKVFTPMMVMRRKCECGWDDYLCEHERAVEGDAGHWERLAERFNEKAANN